MLARSAAIVTLLTFFACSIAQGTITVDWATVGNAGNAPDSNGIGAVAYNYNISKYDVTVAQYVEFLNSKDPTGANVLELYNSEMSSTPFGSVNFASGGVSGQKYSAIDGHENYAMNFVNWFDAVRFVNWMQNGQGTGDTESGAYTLEGGTPIPSNSYTVERNSSATMWLPSQDEWYKAAYYEPTTDSYWLYGTSSNTAPTASGPTAAANAANYNSVVGHPTDVGAYSGTVSPYGAFDMAGNVYQWTDTIYSSALSSHTSRYLSGGGYNSNDTQISSAWQPIDHPDLIPPKLLVYGFRVAGVPEPSTLALAAIGGIALVVMARRRAVRSRA